MRFPDLPATHPENQPQCLDEYTTGIIADLIDRAWPLSPCERGAVERMRSAYEATVEANNILRQRNAELSDRDELYSEWLRDTFPRD